MTNLFSGLEVVLLEKLRKKTTEYTTEWVIHNTNAKTQNISMFISLLNVLRRRSHTIVVRSFSEKQYTKLKRGFIIWVSVFGRQTAFDCLKTDASTVESISSTFSERSHLSLSSPKGKDSTALKTLPAIFKQAACGSQAQLCWTNRRTVSQQDDLYRSSPFHK